MKTAISKCIVSLSTTIMCTYKDERETRRDGKEEGEEEKRGVKAEAEEAPTQVMIEVEMYYTH